MNVDKPISFNVLEDDDINFIKVIHDTFVPTYFFPLFTFVFQIKLLNVTTFNVGFYFCHQGPISASMYLYVNGIWT